MIDAIPEGSIDYEWDIDLAYAAYAALSAEDRAQVTNYDTLRTRLEELAAAHVAIRVVIPGTSCRFHAINDPGCSTNAAIADMIRAWSAVSDRLLIEDNVSYRSEWGINSGLELGINLPAMYDNMQFFRENGAIGYRLVGDDNVSLEMGELRNYLMSCLLLDADMTREAYLTAMDEFLRAYYGAGWTYIRQYIDKIWNTEGINHGEYKDDGNAVIYRVVGTDASFLKDCLALWDEALDAAETEEYTNRVERSMLHILNQCIEYGDRQMLKKYTSLYQNLMDKHDW